MCGRIVQLPLFSRDQAPFPELVDELSSLTAKYNLCPTQRVGVVMADDGTLEVRKLRWGLVPHWARDLKGTYSTINARVETVAEKPSFRAAWKAPRRCLVPMQGWYEWREELQGGKTVKQPYYARQADNVTLWAAGLWEPRHPLQPEDEGGSVTLITHDAPERFELHDRVPFFLDPAMASEWMGAAPDDAMAMLLSAEFPELKIVRVSRRVNSSRNNFGGPDFIDPIDD